MFQMALTLADRAVGAIIGAAVADAAGTVLNRCCTFQMLICVTT